MTFKPATWAMSAIALACVQAHALDFKTDDGLVGKVTGVVTFGTQIRADDPSPEAYGARPAATIGVTPAGQLAGQNGGPNLNFSKGDQISTVLKAVVDLDLKKDNIGLFIRGSAWKDFAQGEKNVAYGNFPQGYTPGTPLSDRGFARSSEFSNAEFRDVYLYGSTKLEGGKALDGRLGRQVLNWGGSRLIGGGIGATTNPLDASSALRPGAQPFEGRLPLGMLSAKLAEGNAWNLEGFAAYEHRGNVYPACGTYFDAASFLAKGCNMISFATASEAALLTAGNYVRRNADVAPNSGKHFGVSVGFKPAALDADVKVYAMNTTSVAPSYRMTVNSATPGTAATSYALMYPEDVLVLGTSFAKKVNAEVNAFGELAYRPNQPISYNASDLLAAFVNRSGTSLLNLRKNALATPVGGTFDAYDRFGVVTGSVGASKTYAKTLGADVVAVTGEVGFSRVNGLPGQDVLRFGRGTAYGAAAYRDANGALTACTDSVAGKTCTTDGYTTANSWGVRLIASAVYRNAIAGATVTPSLLVAKDVKGYSHDGTFSEGRASIRPGVRAEWQNKYFAELQYTKYSGGKYNLMVDRDYFAAVAGLRF